MMRRRSLAVLVLMVGLTLGPSLALAAAVCAPHCCPAAASAASGGPDPADDCRAGFANRSCCNESIAPVALASPTVSDGPALPTCPAALEHAAASSLRAPGRRSEAQRALRTSRLRLSVVLLI